MSDDLMPANEWDPESELKEVPGSKSLEPREWQSSSNGSKFSLNPTIKWWRRMGLKPPVLIGMTLCILIAEAVIHLSGAFFIDPYSHLENFVSVLFVFSISSVWVCRAPVMAKNGKLAPPWLEFCRSTALIIGGYWATAYTLLCIGGVIAYVVGSVIAFVGEPFTILFTATLGLLILFFLVLVSLNPLWLWLSLRNRQGVRERADYSRAGLIFGLSLLTLKLVPVIFSSVAVHAKLLTLARLPFVPEYELKRAVAGSTGENSSLESRLFRLIGASSEPDDATKFFYQVTGNRYEPEERFFFASTGFSSMFSFNRQLNQQGGDAIGDPIPELKLSSTELVGRVDPKAHLVNWEWTFEFQNNSSNEQEARMRILLPPDAVTTRLNLWVNGVMEEAAFGGSKQVADAYKQVVRVERRDPVLARWWADDELMIQCFPVPANGGKMKIRIACTGEIEAGRYAVLPQLIAKNFQFAGDLNQSARIEGAQAIKTHGESPDQIETERILEVSDLAAKQAVWVKDRFAKNTEHAFIEFTPADGVLVEKTVKYEVVIDGSAKMGNYENSIYQILKQLESSELVGSFYLANDDGFEKYEDIDTLKDEFDFVGGRDCIKALSAAAKQAERKGHRVLWLHVPKPLLIESPDSLERLISNEDPILSLQFGTGPASLLTALRQKVERVRRRSTGDLSDQVIGLLAREVSKSGEWKRMDVAPETAQEASGQLTRWWAWNQLQPGSEKYNDRHNTRIDFASRYQLVTPECSAVVLENALQYENAGLKQITNGSIPEPSSTAMIFLSVTAVLFRRRRSDLGD